MRTRVRRWLGTVACGGSLLVPACTSFSGRVDPAGPELLPDRQVVRVWSGDKAQRFHRLRIVGDTLTAIPFLQPVDCDKCQVSIPLSAVDSMTFAQGDEVAIAAATAPFVILIAFLLTWRASEGD